MVELVTFLDELERIYNQDMSRTDYVLSKVSNEYRKMVNDAFIFVKLKFKDLEELKAFENEVKVVNGGWAHHYVEITSILKYILELSKQEAQKGGIQSNNDLLVHRILNNFDNFARQISRRHNNRDTIIIQDEYDVQDCLLSIFKLIFNDVRDEVYIGEVAGRNTRADFIIRDINTLIEVKCVRKGLRDKQLGDELSQDIIRYQEESSIDKIIFFIYDKEREIGNPNSLINDLENASVKKNLKVIFSPKI